MFASIMFPVDLAHLETLEKALNVTADLARLYAAEVHYVGVTTSVPTKQGRNPKEYAKHLSEFAAEQAKAHDIKTSSKCVIVGDPVADVDDALMKAITETGCDLVVMASHAPGIIEYLWPSNGGKIASHAQVSVMVVRQ